MCRRHGTPEVAIVPTPGEFSRPRDHRVSSEIGTTPDPDGRLPYTLRIRVFLSEPVERNPDGTPFFIDRTPAATGGFLYRRFNCQPMTPALMDSAFSAMVDSVNVHWNGKLWLSARRDDVPDLSCRIELERVFTAAESNLHVTLIHAPHREFRDYCWRGGRPATRTVGEMLLAYPQPGATGTADQSAYNLAFERVPTSDQGAVTIQQNIFCHELGHYLTLDHTCVHLDTTGGNGNIAYCRGRSRARQELLMSSGNRMHRNYAREWLTRLERHHYHCERSFRPMTVGT